MRCHPVRLSDSPDDLVLDVQWRLRVGASVGPRAVGLRAFTVPAFSKPHRHHLSEMHGNHVVWHRRDSVRAFPIEPLDFRSCTLRRILGMVTEVFFKRRGVLRRSWTLHRRCTLDTGHGVWGARGFVLAVPSLGSHIKCLLRFHLIGAPIKRDKLHQVHRKHEGAETVT